MAAIHGVAGNFSATVGAVEVFAVVRSWTAKYSRTNFDVTSFADASAANPFVTRCVGLGSLEGSLEGFIDIDTSQATNFSNWLSDAVAFVLSASATRTYTFTGQFKTQAIDVRVGQPMTIRGDFKATGAITIA